MDRRLMILIAGTIAILVGALAAWLAYNLRPGDVVTEDPVPAPPPVVVTPPVQPPLQPVPTEALPNLAGRVLADGCRQGECHWSRAVRLESVGTFPEGELRRLTARGGTSTYDPSAEHEPPEAYSAAVRVTWDATDRSDHAFCSRRRPAYAFPDDGGGTIIHYLDLYDLAGYQLASARAYMRICHDAAFDGDDEALLRRLGYRPGTRNEQVESGRPEDMTRF
jgi:hypothetical protein